MPRIKLIVTGVMEKKGLHLSLAQAFPGDQNGEPVIWDTPHRVNCATSHRLNSELPPTSLMISLAKAMVAAVGIGKNGAPADLVVVIDDLELANLDQECVVAKCFRSAVESVLSAYSLQTQERYRKLLREKCSFHLLKPMVEAYLFGDVQALQVAGIPDTTTPLLVHPTDVESFQTNDPLWLPTCIQENVKRSVSIPQWRHECHPKHYLIHLGERGQSDFEYEEAEKGCDSLVSVNWQQVPKQAGDTPILRALFEDLADWFGLQNPLGNGNLNPYLYPASTVNRANLVLRNM